MNKINQNPNESKYSKKLRKRREAAKRLGLPRNATWPEINAEQERQEAEAWKERQT